MSTPPEDADWHHAAIGLPDLDLSERLLIARRGTAYFAQRLAALSDNNFSGDTLLAGWSRRHLVAHSGTTPPRCVG